MPSLYKCMCIKYSIRWWWEIKWKPLHQEHAAHLMVILKSRKEELHWFFPLLANTKSQAMHIFVVYDYRSSKISPVRFVEPHIIFLNTQWLQITVSLSRMEPSDCALMPACRVWLSLHLLLSTYPLLGTYLLTTYTYKCMHLLTRIYSMCSIPILSVCTVWAA